MITLGGQTTANRWSIGAALRRAVPFDHLDCRLILALFLASFVAIMHNLGHFQGLIQLRMVTVHNFQVPDRIHPV